MLFFAVEAAEVDISGRAEPACRECELRSARKKEAYLLAHPCDVRVMNCVFLNDIQNPVIFVRRRLERPLAHRHVVEEIFGPRKSERRSTLSLLRHLRR